MTRPRAGYPHALLLAAGLVGAAFAAACDRSTATTPTTTAPAACPKCECKCSCPDGPGQTVAASGSAPATHEEIDELTYAMSRKIAKRDGTCMADFTRLEKLSPTTARRMGMLRGQCLMIAGKCSAGAEIMRKEMAQTQEWLDEQLDRTMETMTSMYCTGPLDDRGELLRALMELQRGAYQGNIGIRACTNATKTIARLKGRVRPKDDEDTQISSISASFGYTAAACFARAGDCSTAWRVFNDHLPGEPFRTIADPQQRATIIRDSFDSTVVKCKGRV